MLATIYSGVVPGDTPFRNITKNAPARRGAVPDRSLRGRWRVRLERVKDFELPGVPAAKVDRITVKIVAPPRAAQDVLRGKLDYMLDPPPPDMLREVRSKHADRYRESPTEGIELLLPELEHPALRQARRAACREPRHQPRMPWLACTAV